MVTTTQDPGHVPFRRLVKAMQDCDVEDIKRFAATVTTPELHSIVRMAFAHRLPNFRRTMEAFESAGIALSEAIPENAISDLAIHGSLGQSSLDTEEAADDASLSESIEYLFEKGWMLSPEKGQHAIDGAYVAQRDEVVQTLHRHWPELNFSPAAELARVCNSQSLWQLLHFLSRPGREPPSPAVVRWLSHPLDRVSAWKHALLLADLLEDRPSDSELLTRFTLAALLSGDSTMVARVREVRLEGLTREESWLVGNWLAGTVWFWHGDYAELAEATYNFFDLCAPDAAMIVELRRRIADHTPEQLESPPPADLSFGHNREPDQAQSDTDFDEAATDFTRERFLSSVEEVTKAKIGEAEYQDVPVLVVTSRHPDCKLQVDTKCHYAATRVSIPEFPSSPIGTLQRPSIFQLFGRKNPAKFVEITDRKDVADLGDLLRTLEFGDHAEADVLVFCHGFNVSESEAIRKAAKIRADLQFRGLVFCFSWPSFGVPIFYAPDEGRAEEASDRFFEFIVELSRRLQGRSIHVLAHSMGNRVVLGALKRIAREKVPCRIDQLIPCAADVRANVYMQSIGPVARITTRISSYSSAWDPWVRLSQLVHIDQRAGTRRPPIIGEECRPKVSNLDAIDATPLGGIAHGYFAGNAGVLLDIASALRRTPASERPRLAWVEGKYWLMRR